MKKYITRCGLYCGACSSMLLYELQQGEPDAGHFVREYEESPCAGCGAGSVPDCEFIRCCDQHEIECCAFCPEFPCEMIKKFSRDEWAHHIDVVDNLARIKEIGAEAWWEEQRRQWSCPGCGKRTHWYQSKCPVCGAEWEAHYQ